MNAPATPCTTSDAIESWKPKRVTSHPPELQPQAASMIQTTEPSSAPRMRNADSRTRSIRAPDMIDAVVHEKRRNARKNTPLMWSLRFGPIWAAHGAVFWQNPRRTSSPSTVGLSCPSFGQPSSKQP